MNFTLLECVVERGIFMEWPRALSVTYLKNSRTRGFRILVVVFKNFLISRTFDLRIGDKKSSTYLAVVTPHQVLYSV